MLKISDLFYRVSYGVGSHSISLITKTDLLFQEIWRLLVSAGVVKFEKKKGQPKSFSRHDAGLRTKSSWFIRIGDATLVSTNWIHIPFQYCDRRSAALGGTTRAIGAKDLYRKSSKEWTILRINKKQSTMRTIFPLLYLKRIHCKLLNTVHTHQFLRIHTHRHLAT